MNPLTLLGDSLKALASPQRLTYAPHNSSGYTLADFGASSFWRTGSPGAKRDYATLVGDPLQNYVIAAAVNAISLALPDAPPYLEQLQEGRWKRVDDHPVLDFLRQPHEDLGDADVWSLTSLYRVTRGEAFWVIQLNSVGLPAEAVPYDPRRVRIIGTREQLISQYEVTTEEGRVLLFPKEQILHFRHLPDPNNLRRGWTPLSTGHRQLVGSNSASTYHTALLLNGAVSSWLISMKDASQGTVSPEQFQTFIDAMRRKYAGTTESAGGIDGLSIPLEIQRMAYSPDEMAIDKLIDYYEQTLCALTGVSKKILDLGADSTYLNLREAINDFWERRLVPMRNKDARALTNQLLPLFGLDKTQWRVRFDFSGVPALQENQDGLFTRWRDLYKAGGCDLFTLQSKIGLPDVPANYKERFFGQKSKDDEDADDLEGKAIVWVESEHPRDKNGRFGNGSHRAVDSVSNTPKTQWKRISNRKLDELLPNVPHLFAPSGQEVSKGLELAPNAQHLQSVVEAIARVHGDGKLPRIPVSLVPKFRGDTRTREKQGEFNYNSETGEAENIQVRAGGDAPELAALHEIAHFLDFKGLETGSSGTGTFSSKRMLLKDHPEFTEAELQDLHAAITGSASYQKLLEYRKKKQVQTTKKDGGMTYNIDQNHVEYLLSSEEIFARAYCQYVATRSGNEALRKQIADTRLPGGATSIGGMTKDSLKYPEYWSPSDFEPIGKAMDEVFQKQGWLTDEVSSKSFLDLKAELAMNTHERNISSDEEIVDNGTDYFPWEDPNETGIDWSKIELEGEPYDGPPGDPSVYSDIVDVSKLRKHEDTENQTDKQRQV